MSENWDRYKIGELYNIFSGLSKPRDQFGYGHPFVTFKDVFQNYFLPENLGSLANTTIREQQSCSVKKGDIFLTRTSETQHELGMSSVALKDYEHATFNGFTKRLRLKQGVTCKIDLLYLGYFLRSSFFRDQIAQHSSLTTRASLNATSIESLILLLPPIEIQRKIGCILKSLDDKIELNRQTNQTLEAIAQALFKEWFVDFNFPGATGEMEDSELGEIPKGWRVESLDEIAEFLNGLALQKFPAKDDHDYLPVIKIRELKNGITDSSDRASKEVPAKYIIEDGDLLFSWSGTLEVRFWIGGKGALNQHLFKVTSKKYPLWFCYLWTLYHLTEFKKIAEDKTTTMGHIQRKHLTDAKCLIPKNVEAMDKCMAPLIESFINNEKEVRTLTELRDTLLPKLMNGEIKIN